MKGSDVVRAPLKLFISYSRTNSNFVDYLTTYLRAKGYEVWVDRKGIEAGYEWKDKIEQAVKDCNVMLVILSPASVSSKFVKMEYRYALTHNKTVLPLEYQHCDVPIDLDGLHRITFQPYYEKGLADLLNTLYNIAAGTYKPREQPYRPIPDPSPPYRQPSPSDKTNSTGSKTGGATRRAVLLGITGLVGFAVVEAFVRLASPHGGSANTSNPTPTPSGKTPKWTFSMSSITGFSPVVANGLLYTSDGSKLYALDAAMGGTAKWSFSLQSSGPFSPPAPKVGNGHIYVYSGFENGVSLYALDAATGTPKWHVQTADTASSIYLPPPPIMAGSTIYTSANSTVLYALDALSGRKRWAFQSDVYGFASTVAGGVVYTNNVSTTYALDAASGSKLWTFLNSNSNVAPVVAKGTVYITGGKLYALDAATGREKWNFTRLGPDILTVANGIVYTFYNKILYALDSVTGHEKWHFWQNSDACSAPVVGKGVVYISAADGHLYALDETSGQQKWAIATDVSPIGWPGAPVVNNGMIYISDSTNLQAVDISGKQKWSFTLGIARSITSPVSPTIANGLIYVNGGSNDDGSTGTKLYTLPLP